DIVFHIIPCNRHTHRVDRPLTHRIGKAVSYTHYGRDRCQVQNSASSVTFHHWNYGIKGIIGAFYIDVEDPLKVAFCTLLEITYVRYARIVDQDVNPADRFHSGNHLLLIAYVTGVHLRRTTPGNDAVDNMLRHRSIQIQDVNTGPFRSKQLRNCLSNTAPATSNDGNLIR